MIKSNAESIVKSLFRKTKRIHEHTGIQRNSGKKAHGLFWVLSFCPPDPLPSLPQPVEHLNLTSELSGGQCPLGFLPGARNSKHFRR